MFVAPNYSASCGFADAIITLSGEDSASCQNNHHISSPHVRHQRVPDCNSAYFLARCGVIDRLVPPDERIRCLEVPS